MKKRAKTIIITGNHHTPAYELIRQLNQDQITDWQIYYLSHPKKLDTHLGNSIIPSLKPNHFFPLDSAKLDRNSLLKSLSSFPKIISAIYFSQKLINQIHPDVVVSFGGYISTPLVLAAFLKHIPIITHEQTPTFGLSTKINSLFATKVALSFPPKKLLPKFVLTGNLLRQEIFHFQPKNFSQKIKPFIYITGGSQGSAFLNQNIAPILKNLCQKFTIVHQTGNQPIKNFNHPKYLLKNYIGPEDIGFILNQSELIISRSGANICQEIVALNKKSILIPLPFSQQNEQLLNARWVKNKLPHHTIILPQSSASPQTIRLAINKLYQKTIKSTTPAPKPNYKLLKLIHELVAD